MIPNFLSNTNFHSFLFSIDEEITKELKQKGCPCGGKLHQANYPRSPFGLPANMRVDYELRLSFCCANCRKRITPPSVRFFGRRWFVAPVFVFVCLLTLGINERRLQQFRRYFGIRISESTWKRWRRWWRDKFTHTAFWKQSKGLVATSLLSSNLKVFPRALWLAFKAPSFEEKLKLLLEFLKPLTGGILRAV